MAPQNRIFLPILFVCLFLTTISSAFAQTVYFGGDKIRKMVPPSSPNILWNSPGGPVALDTAQSRVYWGDNSTIPGKIKWGNINGGGTINTLLTTVAGERIENIEIDTSNQMIYWTDWTTLHIWRSPIGTPAPFLLPLSPATVGTLRDIALDLRGTNPKLYWLDGSAIHRADLNGANPQTLPNSLNGLFFALAIDPCTDHIIVLGRTNGNPYSSVIERVDLSNAGNETVLLQDPAWPPSNIGEDPRDIALVLTGAMMYWTADHDANNLPTVRRADLSGANPQVLAQGTSAWGSGEGIAVESAGTSCSNVGVNKDLQNNTGQVANDIEITLAGSPVILSHYDGYPANFFSSFTATQDANGNTLFRWANPNNDVQPGQIAHVGFTVAGSSVSILSVSWTKDGNTIGCAQQVSTNTHSWGTPGSQIIYANNCLACRSVPRFVGGLIVEWYPRRVPLADLNNRTRRRPMRTDVIRRPPILIAPNATARVDVPAAPPDAQFGVVVHKVSTNPQLTGPDVTTDFLEFAVTPKRSRQVTVTKPLQKQ